MKRSLLVFVAVLGLMACTRDGADLADAVDLTDPGDPADSSGSTEPPTSLQPPSVDPLDSTSTTFEPPPSTAAPAAPTTAPPIVEVPETGVPGLDSDDAFCSAWSRFGGSWQVLLVGSTFLDDPGRVATWEVASAPTIDAAYAALVANFPDELESEATVVADAYFGALHRRAVDALASLDAAGSNSESADRLSRTWLEALARRDPLDADLAFDVPADLQELVGLATDDFRSKRVEFHLDPSMVVGVETPLTDSFLETACPDQGTLTGQEVGDG